VTKIHSKPQFVPTERTLLNGRLVKTIAVADNRAPVAQRIADRDDLGDGPAGSGNIVEALPPSGVPRPKNDIALAECVLRETHEIANAIRNGRIGVNQIDHSLRRRAVKTGQVIARGGGENDRVPIDQRRSETPRIEIPAFRVTRNGRVEARNP